jgi:hypothetical protein
MAALKAGSIDDFAGSMAAKIEAAMQEEWLTAYGRPLSHVGDRDRMVLFAAIAKGVLRYLYDHRDDLVTDRVTIGPSIHRHDMAFDLQDHG